MTIVQWVDRSAIFKSTAVNPYHDRFFSICHFVRFPYVQIKAVFALIVIAGFFAGRLSLTGTFSVVIRLIDTVIWNNFYWGFPAQVANRLLANKRNTFESNDIIRLLTDEGTIDALDGQRLVKITIRNLFVLAV